LNPLLFDRSEIFKRAKQIHRRKPTHVIIERAAKTLVERLSWTNKTFQDILILGPYSYVLMDVLKELNPDFLKVNSVQQCVDLDFDSEIIPFSKDSFDCIISFFDFETVNDVPGTLRQLYYCLKPNGLLTGVYLGGNSLEALRRYFLEQELIHNEGAGVRFHPTISAEDMSYLLQRAGFDCPMTDHDHYTMNEMTAYKAIQILRNLNSVNALTQKPPYPGKSFARKIIKDESPLTISLNLIYITALGSTSSSQEVLERKNRDLIQLKNDN
jgi:hypothetical protein